MRYWLLSPERANVAAHMMKSILFTILTTTFAFACGGGSGDSGSGVDGGKTLVSLNDGEITQLCEYQADVEGGARTVTCPDGELTIEPTPVAECVENFQDSQDAAPNCTVTVSQLEACAEDIAALSDAEICENDLPASCAPLFAPACQGE
jgi:hypothetical protein